MRKRYFIKTLLISSIIAEMETGKHDILVIGRRGFKDIKISAWKQGVQAVYESPGVLTGQLRTLLQAGIQSVHTRQTLMETNLSPLFNCLVPPPRPPRCISVFVPGTTKEVGAEMD